MHTPSRSSPRLPRIPILAWSYSDVVESGTYSCAGNGISAEGFNETYTGEVDPDTGILTWEGSEYELR